ncbi:MAG: ethanolamine ammonia-lyase reactivating factor EutA [Cyanobacteria bacterium REEB67]|nr:ethanolamine ammonia-lyase reactivating factor EutA [Cyanobacteria bacterium REEB67]
MHDRNRLLSVGIDIGTTTTHLVLSSLSFGNVARPTQINKLGIVDKEILFQSTIYETPLQSDGTIDAKAVSALIETIYKEAANQLGPDLDISLVQTGAVIITGESAAKRNAEAVCQAVAKFAGEFVVESAGANLESILCARGSGAQTLSKLEGIDVLSIDIGGGTSNIALIERGEITKVGALALGGRAIRFKDGRIEQVSEVAAQKLGRNLAGVLESESQQDLDRLARWMAAEILDVCKQQKEAGPEAKISSLWLTESNFPGHEIDRVIFSGGVAELMKEDRERRGKRDDPEGASKRANRFNDFGPYLARAINQALADSGITHSFAENAIRATVLGAGMHTLQLSGSTVGYGEDSLPLRNLPLLKIDVSESALIPIYIQKILTLKEIDWQKENVAFALQGLSVGQLQYTRIKALAEQLALVAADLSAPNCPLVLTIDQDIAMALSQLLKRLLPDKRIITVDGITVEDGDYLDIGKPVNTLGDPNTRTLPVVVKTLIFYKN